MYQLLKCFEKRILLEDAAVNTKQNSNKHVFSTTDFLLRWRTDIPYTHTN